VAILPRPRQRQGSTPVVEFLMQREDYIDTPPEARLEHGTPVVDRVHT